MDAGASVKNVRGLFGILAEKKSVTLTEEVPPDLPKAMADPERLDHVVANLVSNSLKFTPAGGQIVVGARAENGKIVLWVGDTGKGISPENLGKLFRRFGQVDVADQRAKRVTGTGLGLYIVKQTVEGMGGRIDVTSELGKGSCFAVTLAAAPPGATVPPAGLHD
jgi:signal transduction histidine kinase